MITHFLVRAKLANFFVFRARIFLTPFLQPAENFDPNSCINFDPGPKINGANFCDYLGVGSVGMGGVPLPPYPNFLTINFAEKSSEGKK